MYDIWTCVVCLDGDGAGDCFDSIPCDIDGDFVEGIRPFNSNGMKSAFQSHLESGDEVETLFVIGQSSESSLLSTMCSVSGNVTKSMSMLATEMGIVAIEARNVR